MHSPYFIKQKFKASYQLLKLCSSFYVGPQACFLVTRPVLFTALSPPQRGIYCFECDAQDSPDTCRDIVMCDFDHVSKPFYRKLRHHKKQNRRTIYAGTPMADLEQKLFYHPRLICRNHKCFQWTKICLK